jgi:hypothetical protein
MFPLKPLHRDSIDGALAKAERYRLLNEPGEAESICLDILEVDPGNQVARVALLLTLTDQFVEYPEAYARAREVLGGLDSEYDRAYYGGIIAERRAKAQLTRHGQGVYDWLVDAMKCFERAEQLRPAHNDDAVLRWNACVRFLQRHPNLRPGSEERAEMEMLE